LYIAAHIEIQYQFSCALPYWLVWWIFSLAPISSFFFCTHHLLSSFLSKAWLFIGVWIPVVLGIVTLGSLFKTLCNTFIRTLFGGVICAKSACLFYLTVRTPIDKHYLICSAALSQPYLKSETRLECYNSINNFMAFTDSNGPESTDWSISTQAVIVRHWYW
jgi:hypothetical protein